MLNETCILTTKDFTILEAMRDRHVDPHDPLAPILARKLKTARMVLHDDIPGNVATLNSRVTFRVDGACAETRVLSHERMNLLVGVFQPITTPRGLALLGLAEGQEYRLVWRGLEERVVLDAVNYQPEAARHGRLRDGGPATGTAGRFHASPGMHGLRLVHGARADRGGEAAGD
ncbi:nucleoside-diphosphate kinase [Stappia sp.]|uniref:nucleoside-diphosphate kinase n=1 Tax=Stappia sp. TaxID=1870903 RepID=UPI003A9A0914